jgi:glycine cleavage system aminomethyltransferase T
MPVRILLTRSRYVGELGWELYVPVEFAAGVYERLHDVAADCGLPLRDAGYYAIESMRVEKAFRAWGHELSPMVTPAVAGLNFAVAYDKPGGFIGQAAALAAREQPNLQRCVNVRLDQPEVFLYGGETVLRDGESVGFLTSTSYGHSVGAAMGMGILRGVDSEPITAQWVKEGTYEVLYNGVRLPAHASLRPFFDPRSERTQG